MDNKSKIEKLLVHNHIGWVSMSVDGENVMVEFLHDQPEWMQKRLDAIKEFSEVRLLSSGVRRCKFVIRLAREEPTLVGAFAELARSTAEFHKRFETDKHIGLPEQWARVVEEFHEVEAEIEAVQNGKANIDLSEEFGDWLVTFLGAAWFAGLTNEHLAAAMLEVADKNDKKTLLNCTWHEGKVTRNEKLPGGGA